MACIKNINRIFPYGLDISSNQLIVNNDDCRWVCRRRVGRSPTKGCAAMTSEKEPLRFLFRRKRLEAGLTQTELARETGCSQSAVSMFEAGRADALSKQKLAAVAERLGIEAAQLSRPVAETVVPAPWVWGYCPIEECPSNFPYCVRGRLCFRPTVVRTEATKKTFCRHCGELLETSCPNLECAAPVDEGAVVCPECGAPYVRNVRLADAAPDVLEEWASEHRALYTELLALTSRNEDR